MLPYNKIAELAIPTVSSYVAFYTSSYFSSKGQLLSSIIAAVVLVSMLTILSVIWFNIQKTGIVDHRFLCLGNWIQTLKFGGQTYVALIAVRHSMIKDEFIVAGDSYAVENLGEPYATWRSSAVSFAKDDIMIYVQAARVRNENITGFTTMIFAKGDGRRYYGGTGSVLDDDKSLEPLDFTFEVRGKILTKSLLGKNRIQTVEDRILFLRSYVASRALSSDGVGRQPTTAE